MFKLRVKEECGLYEFMYICSRPAALMPTLAPNNYNSKYLNYNQILFLKGFMVTPPINEVISHCEVQKQCFQVIFEHWKVVPRLIKDPISLPNSDGRHLRSTVDRLFEFNSIQFIDNFYSPPL